MVGVTVGNWNSGLLGNPLEQRRLHLSLSPIHGRGGRGLGIDPPALQLKAAPRCC